MKPGLQVLHWACKQGFQCPFQGTLSWWAGLPWCLAQLPISQPCKAAGGRPEIDLLEGSRKDRRINGTWLPAYSLFPDLHSPQLQLSILATQPQSELYPIPTMCWEREMQGTTLQIPEQTRPSLFHSCWDIFKKVNVLFSVLQILSVEKCKASMLF